jgi:cyanophycinase
MMRLPTFLLCALIAITGTAHAEGRLVIAGGAVTEENAAVWGAFAEALRPEGQVLIVAGASSEPQASAKSARRALMAVGVPSARIETAPLAVRDDPSTPDIDEADWSDGGRDSDLAEAVQAAAGIWFTGGDQSRLAELLFDADGEPLPVLAAMHAARSDGAVIGGTSAGAAMMSRLMITGGSSLEALIPPKGRRDGPGFTAAQGLGFLPVGVTDQHFGERARLGRLIRAVTIETEPARRIGFGVDEGTALLVDDDAYHIVGEGYVTIVDASNAAFGTVEDRLWAEGLVLHLLATGDRIAPGGEVVAAPFRNPTLRDEYYDDPPNEGGGMAIGGTDLADVIGADLLDNGRAREVAKVSFGTDGRGVRYRFGQPRSARGFWGRGEDGVGRYTVTGVTMSVEPVDIEVKELPR